jgi:hypothetical protein
MEVASRLALRTGSCREAINTHKKSQEGQYCANEVAGGHYRALEVTCQERIERPRQPKHHCYLTEPNNIPTRPRIDLRHELTPRAAAAAPATGSIVTLPLHASPLLGPSSTVATQPDLLPLSAVTGPGHLSILSLCDATSCPCLLRANCCLWHRPSTRANPSCCCYGCFSFMSDPSSSNPQFLVQGLFNHCRLHHRTATACQGGYVEFTIVAMRHFMMTHQEPLTATCVWALHYRSCI